MRAFTNINDNQWLREAKRHKPSSSPRTSRSTVPRTCNYRCLKRCLQVNLLFFFIGEYKIAQLCNSLSQGLCSQRSRVGYYGTIINPCCQEDQRERANAKRERKSWLRKHLFVQNKHIFFLHSPVPSSTFSTSITSVLILPRNRQRGPSVAVLLFFKRLGRREATTRISQWGLIVSCYYILREQSPSQFNQGLIIII